MPRKGCETDENTWARATKYRQYPSIYRSGRSNGGRSNDQFDGWGEVRGLCSGCLRSRNTWVARQKWYMIQVKWSPRKEVGWQQKRRKSLGTLMKRPDSHIKKKGKHSRRVGSRSNTDRRRYHQGKIWNRLGRTCGVYEGGRGKRRKPERKGKE